MPPGSALVQGLNLVLHVERDDGGRRGRDAADHAGDPVRGVVVQQAAGQHLVAAARQDDGHVRAGRAGLGRGEPGGGVGGPTVGAGVYRPQRRTPQALGVPERGDGG